MSSVPVVLDTSALIAILRAEPQAVRLIDQLSAPIEKCISTATLLETRIVLERHLGEPGQRALDQLLAAAAIQPLPLDLLQAQWALQGWRTYGKGNHPAGLNLGDCFSYGLAMALKAPLLFIGDDFGRTDVIPALR
ncbi:MAG: type II toxin-antitoxin system VapC family toxin [Synechococcaceae cyanobacterium]|nr:type II toxin-antitoxin system VapC family toxin [Synechococcaceae cyanobacterium]